MYMKCVYSLPTCIITLWSILYNSIAGAPNSRVQKILIALNLAVGAVRFQFHSGNLEKGIVNEIWQVFRVVNSYIQTHHSFRIWISRMVDFFPFARSTKKTLFFPN